MWDKNKIAPVIMSQECCLLNFLIASPYIVMENLEKNS